MYDPDSDYKLNGDFGMEYYDDNSDNDSKDHIPRARGRSIKKNKKNKPLYLTLKETSLKLNPTKETNKEDRDKTMEIDITKKKTNMK